MATPENYVLNQSLPTQPSRVELGLRFLDHKAVSETSEEEAATWTQLTGTKMTSLQEDLTNRSTVMHSECESLLNRMHVDYGIAPKCSLEYGKHCEKENRGTSVKSFQKHKGGGVFLISIKAGG